MNFEYLPATISAAGGALIGILGAVLINNRKNRKSAASLADAHLKTFYETMNSALTDQEKRHSDSIAQLRAEQREERKQWADERKAFNERIDKLQDQARLDGRQLHAKELEVANLTGKVNVLEERLRLMNGDTSTTSVVVPHGGHVTVGAAA
ncbi:hypothetical protein AB0280_15555 [Pseudarthrobacter sp902506025]|uniref:hypothetical protein n=1 Tax=Pseudarthrobacter sp. 902506025 TaxID=3155291 RepID=UPI003450D283